MRLIAFFLTLLVARVGQAQTDALLQQPAQPSQRVLVLAGGGYHDFHRNTNALLRGISSLQRDAFAFDVLWLGSADETPLRFRNDLDINDPALFDRYDVILGYHQGDLGFTDEVRARFLQFIRDGGGYVAIHSAADSHPGWKQYDAMLGGRFESHPAFSPIEVQVEVADHAITRDLPRRWELEDEFYHLTLEDESHGDKLVLMHGRSPGDPPDAPARPVAWEKNYGSGRVFYTILGHGMTTHSDARFHRLIANALDWAATAPQPNENGIYQLFDGSTLNGWTQAGPGAFLIEDGQLVASGGMGLLWYHERRFRDFTLTVEWKVEDRNDNSGVFVRIPKPSDDPWYAVHHGHEIQIYDAPSAGETRGTGSVYSHADALAGATNPPGEWNTFEITVSGDEYTVVLNGQTVCQWTSPSERHGREGYIGLQNHTSPVRFRNIEVRPLTE